MSDRNGALFFTQLEGYLVTLHDRGVVNEDRLMAVFKDLLDEKPLTLDLLAGIFGVEPIFNLVGPARCLSANVLEGERREDVVLRRRSIRAQLDAIGDELTTSADYRTVPDVVAANLKLVQLLKGVL